MIVPVAMISAVARNGVIGANGRIPWRLSSDFGWLKRQTMGKPVIMGRTTFEGLGKPLDGRINIVVSRTPGYQPNGALVFNDLPAAIGHARALAEADGASEVMIGGGEGIYRAVMPFADRLYISHVDLAPEGDTHFPEIDPAVWQVTEEIPVPPSPKDTATFRVIRYDKYNSAKR